jgi:hypothetical protein
MTFEEMAWEFAEVFDDLDVGQINQMLARNVPMETLGFITEYANEFGESEKLDSGTQKRLPNLMLMGYLLRVLEDRLDPDRDTN